MNKVYSIITNKIIEQLETGVIPWRKPWKAGLEMPTNLDSKKAYTGINSMLLHCANTDSPYFVTYKQAQKLGGNVKKGAKGYPVIFWKKSTYKKKDQEGNEIEENGFILRYYTVFSVSDCEGLEKHIPKPVSVPVIPFKPIEKCEKVVSGYKGKPDIEHKGGIACYAPFMDKITMPKQESFNSPEEYYSTLFHEMVHSTGHEKRLKREGITNSDGFGNHKYTKEELVAEMGASFLSGQAGIDNITLDNSASYIAGWLRKLRDSSNAKWIIEAGSKAQKAVDYINGDLTKA